MNPPAGEDSSITSYHLIEEQLHGKHIENLVLYDLINVTTIYLGNTDDGDRLLGLLRLLFKEGINAAEKKERLQEEYNLNLTDDMREELSIMCNLSEGIFERDYKKGYHAAYDTTYKTAYQDASHAEKEKMALKLLENGIKLSIISDSSGLAIDRIVEIAQANHLHIVH